MIFKTTGLLPFSNSSERPIRSNNFQVDNWEWLERTFHFIDERITHVSTIICSGWTRVEYINVRASHLNKQFVKTRKRLSAITGEHHLPCSMMLTRWTMMLFLHAPAQSVFSDAWNQLVSVEQAT